MKGLSYALGLIVSSTVVALSGVAHGQTIYGMTAVGSDSSAPGLGLVRFDAATPATIIPVGSFTGVVAGQSVRSIDFRPANGLLYAISTFDSSAQLYTVDLNTAALTAVGSGFSLGMSTTARVEMDFNPVADRVRIVTGSQISPGTNNNYRVNPDSGALVATDTNLNWNLGDPSAAANSVSIVGGAYTNNFPGSTSTTLYAWDFTTDDLVTIGGIGGTPSPNTGTMFTVAEATSFLTGLAALGMDIGPSSNTLFVTHDDPANATLMSLYTRDLTTGAESLVGAYPAGVFINDISVVIPEPATASLLILGVAGLATRRRR